MIRACLLLAVFVLAAALPATAYANHTVPGEEAMAEAVARALTAHPKEAAGRTLKSPKLVRDFYARRDHAPAWTHVLWAMDSLERAVKDSRHHGLVPADYHETAIARLRAEGDWLAADLLATDAYLTLASHLLHGKVRPKSVDEDWNYEGRKVDLAAHLERALAAGAIAASLEALAPKDPAYKALQYALLRYRQTTLAQDWPDIPPGPLLKPGKSDARVPALRARLLPAPKGEGEGEAGGRLYDAALADAVRRFQRESGLDDDGIVGPNTLRELNRSPADRVDQIRANLERWRWLPELPQGRHLRVNVAAFGLEAHRGIVVERAHHIIVGMPTRQTPSFWANATYLILNPWWETPPRLARIDKLPQFQEDPERVKRLGYVILDQAGNQVDPDTIDWNKYSSSNFPFRVRQRPGCNNALGAVKIMFPNRFNVYLHDTPSKELFARPERAFSSGCMRVEGVMDLAEWVLAETPGWDRIALDLAVATGETKRVDLARPLPVYVVYFTAVAMDDAVQFYNDVYERDAPLIAALDRGR